MKSQILKKLPNTPGVYFFLKGKKILYIGKATSLKDRVKSYFNKNIVHTRGPLIVKMLEESTNVSFIKTDSVLEALILEASQIKKYQPIYNTKEKSNKSFNYVVITKEDYPRVLIQREREITPSQPLPLPRGGGKGWGVSKAFGPFPHGSELKEAMRIVRKIFPFRDKCNPPFRGETAKVCFNAQIGLCPGVCTGEISKKDYNKIIRHLILFFEGKKPQLVKSLEKEMKLLAKTRKFEEADKVKKTIFALNHIRDVSLLKNDVPTIYRNKKERGAEKVFRIEAYDIAHISGINTVGVMVVVEDGEVNKSQYRKFKIHEDKNNDIANLREVLTRRFNHPEWPMPDLIVVDGGVAQINVAREIFKNTPVVSVVKDERHKAREIIGLKKIDFQSRALDKSILLANSEAHRFAIAYHRNLRGKGFKI